MIFVKIKNFLKRFLKLIKRKILFLDFLLLPLQALWETIYLVRNLPADSHVIDINSNSSFGWQVTTMAYAKEIYKNEKILNLQLCSNRTNKVIYKTFGSNFSQILYSPWSFRLKYRRGLDTAGSQDRALTRTTGQESRATQGQLLAGQERQIGQRGQQERAAIRTTGQETRGIRRTEGQQTRLTAAEQGRQQRAGIRTTGIEERAGTRERGREQRMTDLQQEMFRRYKENRDFEQATGSYRV